MNTSNLPKTQRAWRAVKRGKPSEALVLQTDVPVPSLSPGEVLVKVQAAALNPVSVLSLSIQRTLGLILSNAVSEDGRL
jgi:NADPH:quinone reductase-like Zn-dependent oxidoreductase